MLSAWLFRKVHGGIQLSMGVAVLALALTSPLSAAVPQANGTAVATAAVDAQIRAFLERELSVHLDAIHNLNPPQDRVLGALTTGDFSWGTFMGALAYYSAETGQRQLAGRDLPSLIGQIGLIEARNGGKTWAQLAAARSLLSFGADLAANPVWQSLSPAERDEWQVLLNTDRFYDRKTQQVIHLPSNYYGVAARIAAIDYRLGIFRDKAAVDILLDRAAQQFTAGAIYSDDDPPTGRYDRYPNEYARDLYIAAKLVGRTDLMTALSPSLKEQMKLWWDIVAPDGYAYNWGRTIGDISYMDTLEIVAFLGEYPQFRPAPLPELASVFAAAWRSLRQDFNDQTHLLSIFDYGRGNYKYISRSREWQQTTQFFGKLAQAETTLHQALVAEHVESFPAAPDLPQVARFEFFRKSERPAGVWAVRLGRLRFALPIVTGPEASVSDYQPAPAGLPGIAPPVEQIYPFLVPFIELKDGSILAATDAADVIEPSADGKTLTVTWHRWVKPGGPPATFVSPGLTSTVRWEIRGDRLLRTETLTASKPINVRRWWVAVPSTDDRDVPKTVGGIRSDRLESSHADIGVRLLHADWPVELTVLAPGNGALGRGARRPIPLHLQFESKGFSIVPGKPRKWEIELQELPPTDDR
ncbi:MAG: hypothetical protein ACRD3E_20545 [Terriglobales bacterium]